MPNLIDIPIVDEAAFGLILNARDRIQGIFDEVSDDTLKTGELMTFDGSRVGSIPVLDFGHVIERPRVEYEDLSIEGRIRDSALLCECLYGSILRMRLGQPYLGDLRGMPMEKLRPKGMRLHWRSLPSLDRAFDWAANTHIQRISARLAMEELER